MPESNTLKIKLSINGKQGNYEIQPNERLLDFLRKQGFKGAKKGCAEGTCGACTILLDGLPVYSCIMLTHQAAGHEITTIESLGTVKEPHLIQKTFVEEGAVQCGFCTPGMVLSTYALLEKNPSPTEDEIKTALDGNLCRCTGYVNIINAVKKLALKQGA